MKKFQKVTGRMVAKAAGVSQSTVSKVVNNNAEVAGETARHVIQVAQRMHYALVPRNKKQTVAVIIPQKDLTGYTAIQLSALTEELLSRKMRIEIIFDTQLELLNERCISGGISISWIPELSAAWGRRMLCPLVRINAASDYVNNCWGLYYDGLASMEDLIGRLADLGHRKIAFFSFNTEIHEENNISKRYQGFLRSMEKRNMDSSCRLFNGEHISLKKLVSVIRKWKKDGVTAIIAVNELANMVLDRAIQILNIKVPDELSIVCWEKEGVSEYLTPPRTTLSLIPRSICKKAVEVLWEKMNRKSAGGSDILFPYKLIMRDSVGPAPE